MNSDTCIFCDKTREELPTGIKICDLEYSRLFLFRDQGYAGRCLLVSKKHVAEIYDLPEAEQLGFLRDLTLVCRTIEKIFGADKMNFLSLGDTVGHLHVHIVPKKQTDTDWGGMFQLMRKDHFLPPAQYSERIGLIRRALKASAASLSSSFERDTSHSAI